MTQSASRSRAARAAERPDAAAERGDGRSLIEAATAILTEDDPWKKAARSRRVADAWLAGATPLGADAPDRPAPPDVPGRPARPELRDPRKMPKRGPGSEAGRIARLHAIAHIELNAIDLHWDVIARFCDTPLPRGFYDDWALAAAQEARHFELLSARLEALGSGYGALPAHAGLWRAAQATAHDLPARLAVVPMVLEARGLDVTPDMIRLFQDAGDAASVEALEIIYAEEVGHVAYGSKWFHFLCGRDDVDPKERWQNLVKRYFGGSLKPPFNDEKRAEAGIPLDFYWPLVQETD